MKVFSFEDIETATNCFDIRQQIGKGSHGSVYKGVLQDGQLIAIKKPSGGLQSVQNHLKLDNEIAILASIKKPGIANFIGICENATSKLLITEFMQNGSLHDLIHQSLEPILWNRRAIMALQIARAILSLHEAKPAIIHRDVKSANILFDSKWNARIADFSLAVRVNSMQSVESMIPAGTLGYLDPCYTESTMLSPRNDVFSFGVVLLELVSSRKVMDMDSDPSSIVSWAIPMIQAHQFHKVCDKRVTLPNYMEKPIHNMLKIAEKCVSSKVERRPFMREVVTELQDVVEGMTTTIWDSLTSTVTSKVQKFVRAWKRCAEKRVTNTTTKIVCKDHLVDEDSDYYDYNRYETEAIQN